MSRLRTNITFPDCGPIREVWPDAYADEDDARRFHDAIMAAHPDAESDGLEIECERHGWTVMAHCDDCGWPMCAVEARMAAGLWDVALCEDCQDDRREEHPCGCQSGCPECTGVPAQGPI